MLLIACCAGRLAIESRAPLCGIPLAPQVFWLAVGLVGVCIAASGISTTTFMRRPEYFEAVHGKRRARRRLHQVQRTGSGQTNVACGNPGPSADSTSGSVWQDHPALSGVVFLPAIFGKIEWFLLPYLAAHTMYLGRSWLTVIWKLGR